MTALETLVCTRCGKTFPVDKPQTFCRACNAPLYAQYRLEEVKETLQKEDLIRREPTMWRYRELLPITDERNIVSLGEGYTPLLKPKKIREDLGTENLWVKDEGQIPTGTFKARGISAAVSKAKELGIKKVTMGSAGNAGGALAFYGAQAGMDVFVVMPSDAPLATQLECTIAGAKIQLVEGTIADAAQIAKEVEGFFDMSTTKEPYRVEGKKTMGLEVAEQFDWELPDVIVYPTGGGTGILGMWKAFKELEEMGWVEGEFPKMVSVQSETCAPIVKAFREKKGTSEFWENAQTIASGMRVPKPFADFLILRAMHESKGAGVTVSDEEIMECVKKLAKDGIFACPEGAATLAGLEHLMDEGTVDKKEKVVLFNTGTGMKYLDTYMKDMHLL